MVLGIWGSVFLFAAALGLAIVLVRQPPETSAAPHVSGGYSSLKSIAGKMNLGDQASASTPAPFHAHRPDPPSLRPNPNPSPIPHGGGGSGLLPPPVVFSTGPLVIGHSVQGRPLEVFRFGTGPDVRVIVAGIHGGYEWNTVALAEALIGHLRAHPEMVPDRVTLYILRVMNPDGLARGQWYEGRLNENGVDLNRNFPANWQAEWPNAGCWAHLAVSSGVSPASEPETQAVMDFLQQFRVTALISYHSAALGVFPGGIPLHLPSVQLAQDIAAVTTYPYPPYDTGCLYTGTLADWAAENGIAAVDLELHTHSELDLAENLTVLRLFLSWQPTGLSGR